MARHNPQETTNLRDGVRVSLLTAIVLLGAGGLIGYAVGLPATEITPVAAPIETTVVSASAEPETTEPASYDWASQNRLASGNQAWGIFDAVELDDALWLLVFANVDAPDNRVLWRSEDGATWSEVPLDLDGAIVHDLDVYDGSLLLSGWDSGVPKLWRSQQLPATAPVWTEIALPFSGFAGGVVQDIESDIETVINNDGEIVVAAEAQIEISDLLLDLAGDPDATSLLHLDRLPEVATFRQRLWATTRTATGEETTHVIDLPTTAAFDRDAGPYGTRVGLIVARSLWASRDGWTLDPVDLGGMPAAPLPHAFGDSFAASVTEPEGNKQLWLSADGRTWRPSDVAPPAQCTEWTNLAAGPAGLFLSNRSFDLLCVSATGRSWIVEESPATALSGGGQAWVHGSKDGYVALANNSREFAVLISDNGLEWRPVEFGAGILGTYTLRVGERLVTSVMIVEDDPPGRSFELRVGIPTTP